VRADVGRHADAARVAEQVLAARAAGGVDRRRAGIDAR
jgi:hypothetical protein